MTEVLLASDDISVVGVGSPASISLDLDFGPAGQRGSQIFVGYGDPNDSNTEIGQDPKYLDLYINILPNDSFGNQNSDYLSMYQYINVNGVLSWTKLFKLLPNTYSFNTLPDQITFTAGEATLYVPIDKIVPSNLVGSYGPESFNVQLSIIGQNPISYSITIGSSFETIAGADNLKIIINAIEYSNNSWAEVSGQRVIHGFITVV